jgi:hypothetical protein
VPALQLGEHVAPRVVPRRIESAIATSRSVTPLSAETTSTGRVGRAATSRATLADALASATDVPPNL